MNTLEGRCHCGQIRCRFQTQAALSELEVRACQCSFCRRHGAETVADPNGRLELMAPAEGDLLRYQFGTRSCEMLLCGKCGMYIAAVMDARGRKLATLNVNGMGLRELLAKPTIAVSHDGESPDARVSRRLSGWMPALVRLGYS